MTLACLVSFVEDFDTARRDIRMMRGSTASFGGRGMQHTPHLVRVGASTANVTV